jgi:IS30 family transposase
MESDAESNDILDINEQKTINITGQNNKYQMKKLIKERNTQPKKREVSKKWDFDEVHFNYENHELIKLASNKKSILYKPKQVKDISVQNLINQIRFF